MERLRTLLFSLLLSFCVCDGYKILAIFPMPSPSHGILGDNMIRHLLDGGHEVTYITPFIKKNIHPNLHQVDVSSNKALFDDNTIDITLLMKGVITFQDHDVIFNMMSVIAARTFEHANVQKLMKDPKTKFDVVIGEYMFTDLYSVVAGVFDCPFIWFSTIEPHWMILNLVDGTLNPSYNSDYMNGRIAPYSFTERVVELVSQAYWLAQKSLSYHNKEEEIYLKFIAPIIKEQGKPVPLYNDLRYNASLVLGNTQVAVGEAVALPQNYKHIGGYHIDDDVKPLPEDLKKIMDNSKNGVIYFSLGSNLKSKDLPAELKTGLLKVFKGLKHTVIWKFEEVLPNLPKNVHIVQWAPQQSILAHPNLVLFITHGGLLSMTEAVHFGVPLIAIPVFADQFVNAKRVEFKGIGKKVDLTFTMYENLKVALDEVLGNPKYAAKAKELSTAYHDRPLKPKDELNFWVQHVVRTRGAPHLRSTTYRVPFYQRLYLDLAAAVLITLIVLSLVIKKILCKTINKSNAKEKSN